MPGNAVTSEVLSQDISKHFMMYFFWFFQASGEKVFCPVTFVTFFVVVTKKDFELSTNDPQDDLVIYNTNKRDYNRSCGGCLF